MSKKLSNRVMGNIREYLDIDRNDSSQDEKILQKYSREELFEMFLHWEGIINYSGKIINAIEQIFDTELN